MKFVPPHIDKWKDHINFYWKNIGKFVYLEENDVVQKGDVYSLSNTTEFKMTPGQSVGKECLCYLPRRPYVLPADEFIPLPRIKGKLHTISGLCWDGRFSGWRNPPTGSVM